MLKPFLPQLQTTFIKALNDPNREVRMCAAKALQKLIKLHTRVDPLFTELHNGVKNTEDNNIRLERLPHHHHHHHHHHFYFLLKPSFYSWTGPRISYLMRANRSIVTNDFVLSSARCLIVHFFTG